MRRCRVKDCAAGSTVTRRGLLLGAAALAAGRPLRLLGQVAASSSPTTGPSAPEWMLARESHVCQVRCPSAVRGSVADSSKLGRMLEKAVMQLAGTEAPPQAWRALLGDAQRPLIKFNSVTATLINTNGAMARALIRQLVAAGYEAGAICMVEEPTGLAEELETKGPALGWSGEVRIGDQIEQVAQYWLNADAVINVGALKSHQIAGVSGCCLNISHSIIRRPARYHDNGCSPFVGQVWSNPVVHQPVRLNILSALRVVLDHGPDATDADIATCGMLVAGRDPVAVDSIGLSLLNVQRHNADISASVNAGYLPAAALSGAGRCRRDQIKLSTHEVN